MDSNYYIDLYSAAKFHGVGHQPVQSKNVMTDKSFPNIKISSLSLFFSPLQNVRFKMHRLCENSFIELAYFYRIS
ncbi:type IV toxin-antitoxin system AbiEi family antitoxin [Flavobacteriaceae bacterium F89]|uniref:Type IV toxin-antitoxin system AbiEi family antitoxin n=1 Tax=Cerina litoralis TaxID=2874477 RepID=A0AAE3JR43_9FLAO|nr:type IV toxin-antitoxin system AbiEi family antitoxin [Cerina litoralis]